MIYTNSKGTSVVIPHNKNTRQGMSKHTKLSATSRNGRKKAYRGQGRR